MFVCMLTRSHTVLFLSAEFSFVCSLDHTCVTRRAFLINLLFFRLSQVLETELSVHFSALTVVTAAKNDLICKTVKFKAVLNLHECEIIELLQGTSYDKHRERNKHTKFTYTCVIILTGFCQCSD